MQTVRNWLTSFICALPIDRETERADKFASSSGDGDYEI